jgi:hypothetical protein
VTRSLPAVLAIAALLAPAAALAKPTGVQIEAYGMGAAPFGVYTSQPDGVSSAVEFGGGAGTRLLYGVNRHVYVGASIAYFKNRREYGYAVGLAPPPTLGVRSFLGGPARRALATLPVEAVVQLRAELAKPMSTYVQAGIGVTTVRGKVVVDGASRSAIERDVSAVFGIGYAWALTRDLELVGGLDFHQAWSHGGRVWSQAVVPGYLTFGLGIRYPRF